MEEIIAKDALRKENFTDNPMDYKIEEVKINGKTYYETWGRTNHGNWDRIASGWDDIGIYLPGTFETKEDAQQEIKDCIEDRAWKKYFWERELEEAQRRRS